MATGQIAILEGYQIPRYGKMPRKRKRSSSAKGSFSAIAKRCRKKHKKSAKSFWACVRKAQKRGRSGRKGRRRGRRACPPGCKRG
jgi:hypothetical protein